MQFGLSQYYLKWKIIESTNIVSPWSVYIYCDNPNVSSVNSKSRKNYCIGDSGRGSYSLFT